MADAMTQTTADKGRLTKKELNDIWFRWACTNLTSMSSEKLESHGFAYSMIPIANKYYADDQQKKADLLTRHSAFYNTEPQSGAMINGIVASLEEDIALGGDTPAELTTGVKTALMGPIAGIGDSIIQGIIVPTLLSIAMSLCAGGSITGVLFYAVAWLAVGIGISYSCFHAGYRLGTNAIDVLTGEVAQRIMKAFNVLGIVVTGALAAANVGLATVINIPHGAEEVIPLQEVLDGAMPGLLPLCLVILTWWMISKKRFSATKTLLILSGAAIALSVIGVL